MEHAIITILVIGGVVFALLKTPIGFPLILLWVSIREKINKVFGWDKPKQKRENIWK